MSDTVTVFFLCPCCGEESQIRTEYVIIAPLAEIQCPECGTLWQIEGLIEVEK